MEQAVSPGSARRRAFVAVAILVAVVGAFGLIELVRGGPSPTRLAQPPGSITRFDLGGRPIRRVAVGGGAAWFIVQERGTGDVVVVRIDANTGRVLTLRNLMSPQYVAADPDKIWVVSACRPSSAGRRCELLLYELDPVTGDPRRAIPIGHGHPTGIAADGRGVWVLVDHVVPDRRPTEVLVRIDPTKGNVVAETLLEACCTHDLAVGEGAVWVAAEDRIIEIDPSSNRVVATVHQSVELLAVGTGRLWVNTARFQQAPVLEVDPASHALIQSVQGPGFGYPVVFGGRVWIAVQRMDRIAVFSLSPGAARFKRYPIAPKAGPPRFSMIGGSPLAVAVLGMGNGEIWTGTDESGQVIRIQLGRP